jgi:hypothetical protein
MSLATFIGLEWVLLALQLILAELSEETSA